MLWGFLLQRKANAELEPEELSESSSDDDEEVPTTYERIVIVLWTWSWLKPMALLVLLCIYLMSAAKGPAACQWFGRRSSFSSGMVHSTASCQIHAASVYPWHAVGVQDEHTGLSDHQSPTCCAHDICPAQVADLHRHLQRLSTRRLLLHP